MNPTQRAGAANYCALGRSPGSSNGGTCYNAAELAKMGVDKDQDPVTVCEANTDGDRRCKVDQVALATLLCIGAGCSSKEIVNKVFKPVAPTVNGEFTWLSTNNITAVGKQLMNKFPGFKFLGTVAADFQEYHPDFVQFQLTDHVGPSQPYDKLGVVFNTHPHFRGGEHWIAMFIDCNPAHPRIFFFDSYGVAAPAHVIAFKDLLLTQGTRIGIAFDYVHNPKTFQKLNSECGVYCLDFLRKNLDGMSFHEFVHQSNDDYTVSRLRVEGLADTEPFFRPHHKVPYNQSTTPSSPLS
jgi:hypothetical protein